jgi:hypothetical protein
MAHKSQASSWSGRWIKRQRWQRTFLIWSKGSGYLLKVFFFKSTSRTYHIFFIEGRISSTRQLLLAASNERSTNITPRLARRQPLPRKQLRHNRAYPKLNNKATFWSMPVTSGEQPLQPNSSCRRTIKREDGRTRSVPRKVSSWTFWWWRT